MLAELGYDVARRARRRGGARVDPRARAARARRRACRSTRRSLRSASSVERNEVFTSLIGIGLLRHVHAAGHPAQRAREPRLVHRVHAVPARDLAGPARGALNFQTMVDRPHRMEIANASMLDEATAAAEAMALLHRVNGKAGDVFVVDADCLPQTIDVVRTRAEPLGIDGGGRPIPTRSSGTTGCFGVLLQYPGASGAIRDYRALIERAHADGALVAVAADLLALRAGRRRARWAPTSWSALAALRRAARLRRPARGVLRDARRVQAHAARVVSSACRSTPKAAPAYRLALQTREQHIRREKATSNICTAQVLLAVIAGLYASYHGADGLRAIAERVHRLTCVLVTSLGVGGRRGRARRRSSTRSTCSCPGRAAE